MNPIFPELPTKLGLYTVTERLSTRQHTELYNAYQSYVERAVVLEALQPGSDEAVVNYFQATIQARAGSSLPGVSPVLESARSGAMIYLVQEQPGGEPLTRILLEQRFTAQMGYRLIEALAELYEAGRVKNIAVAPVSADAVYVQEGQVHFLSTVAPGQPPPTLQAEQMWSLADLLEQALPAALLKKSRLATVVQWLRHGYNGRTLEWSTLQSALRALRAKHQPTEELRAGRTSLRIHLRRGLREWKAYRWVAVACLLIVLIVGGVGARLIPENLGGENDPAVAHGRVYIREGEKTYAVQAAPVSIAEYAKFLADWERMSTEDRARLAEDLEGEEDEFTPRLPLDWEEQQQREPGTPVLGVGYAEAILYARYKGETLATAAQIITARKHAPETEGVEEWTSSFSEPRMPYDGCIIVCPSQGDSLIYAAEDDEQVPQRGFRTALQEEQE